MHQIWPPGGIEPAGGRHLAASPGENIATCDADNHFSPGRNLRDRGATPRNSRSPAQPARNRTDAAIRWQASNGSTPFMTGGRPMLAIACLVIAALGPVPAVDLDAAPRA